MLAAACCSELNSKCDVRQSDWNFLAGVHTSGMNGHQPIRSRAHPDHDTGQLKKKRKNISGTICSSSTDAPLSVLLFEVEISIRGLLKVCMLYLDGSVSFSPKCVGA